MSTSRTYTTTGRDIRNQAHRAWLLVLCAVFVATLFAVPSSALAATAHADTGVNPDCDACHKPHQAPTERSLLADVTESEVCYVCHGATPGGSKWNVETWSANSFAAGMSSGHTLQDVTDPDTTMDLTNSCTGCHGVHGDPGLRANLPANEEVAGVTIDPADPRSWCLACHNADHAWYAGSETAGVFTVDAGLKAAYEAKIQDPDRGTHQYPTLGTFPGSTSNATYLASTHATGIDSGTVESLVSVPTETVTRVQGDCLWCHASHRSTATHDGLLGEYRATTPADAAGGATAGEYAQACFECHGNSSGAVYLPAATYTDSYWQTTVGAPDIHTLVTDSSSTRSGHRIRTTSAYYAPDSPLPCYECHNPHGSKNGNTLMISDALGGNLQPDGTAAQVRQFCFSCHTTGDATPAGWDSDANNNGTHDDGVYTTTLANTAVGATAIGISRTAAPPTSYLRLTTSSYHLQASALDCLTCHASAHRPTGGVSEGGLACYGCHRSDTTSLDYEKNMEYDGTSKTSNYHHVMGTASTSGDSAFTSSTYPAAGTDVYCLSCHVDHDQFNSSKSSSLRSSIGSTPSGATASSTDFNTTSGGVCLGCHYVSRTKGADQKSDSTSVTPAIPFTSASAIVAGAVYDRSPHQYQVAGRLRNDDTSFSGDCSKCHSDRLSGTYYKTAATGPEFGLHYDPSRRILEALGRGSVADPYAEERFCYSCHAPTGAGFKATAGADWYGTSGVMDAASENVYTQLTAYASKHTMTLSSSAHRPTSTDEVTSNRLSTAEHVECADCHNPHAADDVNHTPRVSGNNIAATSPIYGVWGVQPPASANWAEPTVTGYTIQPVAAKEYQVCLKCHSGFNSSYSAATRTFSWGSATGWTNQAFEFNTANQSYHPVMGVARYPLPASTLLAPWNVAPGNQTMYCTDCHMDDAATPLAQGPHGSANAWILRGTWNPTVDTITSTSGSTTFLCRKCHVITNTHSAHMTLGRHQNKPCANCHITVPHGGKVPRLLATSSMAGMDLRYSGGSVLLHSFTYPINGIQTNCQSGVGCNPGVHGGAQPTKW
ncbi:MAG: cytochrome c3 family protein [Coriobacteriia bacterium]|nr:cytochrome c3 family protein [Coriobacteriia bacterium]